MLLRAMGLYGDPSTGSNPAGGSGPASSDQLATFVLPSLIVGDGSGAAEIAADQVTAILGSGTETQFQFQGIISSQKPFRDWLTEVLNCCLGFYTWEFGKLKLGCRINASAVDAYTLANSLVSNAAADADPSWVRAPGALVRRRRLSISGQHRGVQRQEPRRLLRARGISAHHTDALGGMLHPEPSAADRGHSHARRDRRRNTRGMARRANSSMADHFTRPRQRSRASGVDDAPGHSRPSTALATSPAAPPRG